MTLFINSKDMPFTSLRNQHIVQRREAASFHKLVFIALSVLFVTMSTMTQTVTATSSSSIPSMMLSNWMDTMILWAGPKNSKDGEPLRHIGVMGMHTSKDWSQNGVRSDTFALKIGGHVYADPKLWGGNWYLLPTGVWSVELNKYDGQELDFTLNVEVTLPPYVPHYIVRYTVSDPSGRDFELLSYLETDKGTKSSSKTWGWYDKANAQFMADLKSSGLYFTSGSIDRFEKFQVGEPGSSSDPLTLFSSGGIAGLKGDDVCESDYVAIGLGFKGTKGSGSFSVFRSLRSDYDNAVAAGHSAANENGDYWMGATKVETERWLSKARRPASPHEFFNTSLLFLKNAQNPTLGTIMASFHPSYDYKVWMRDAIYAAMILDAAGYDLEAEMFFTWASHTDLRLDSSDGSMGHFATCYNFWTGAPTDFVEPQMDSAGLYILSLLYHMSVADEDSLVNARAFVKSDAVSKRMKQIEKLFLSTTTSYGLAPPDYSIWEESSDPVTGVGYPTGYYAYTQALAWAGLKAAARIRREIYGDSATAEEDDERADKIKNGVETYMWDSDNNCYYRQLRGDTLEPDTRTDSSSTALLWTGMIEQSTDRFSQHQSRISTDCKRDEYGLARYVGDIYFYSACFNPAGQESSEEMPAWPLVTLFHSWTESTDMRQKRLNWTVERSAYHYMPVGEAVDPKEDEFIWSSAPDIYEHAGIYVWTVLIHEGIVPIPRPLDLEFGSM